VPGVAAEALALALVAVGTVVVAVQAAPASGGLAPLVAELAHFSGHLDLTELWRWVGR
jgi:hypothetical protein